MELFADRLDSPSTPTPPTTTPHPGHPRPGRGATLISAPSWARYGSATPGPTTGAPVSDTHPASEREAPGARCSKSEPTSTASRDVQQLCRQGLSRSALILGYERGSRTRVSPPMTDLGVEHIFAVNRPCCPVNG